MLDIKFVRENPEAVKENIRKKFQDEKVPLVDEVIMLDGERRDVQKRADELRANRNKLSKEIGNLMAQGKKEEGMALREQVKAQADELDKLSKKETELTEKVTKIMMIIPNMIDESVPIGKDDSENVERENSAIRLCRILKFLITHRLWKALTALILTPQARLRETDFIILWAILQGFIRRCLHMPVIL